MEPPETPECDRLLRFREDGTSTTLENFTEWLGEQGIRLMAYRPVYDDVRCLRCLGSGTENVANQAVFAGWSSSVPESIPATCPECQGQGFTQRLTGREWIEDPRPPRRLLYDFLNVNEHELERERRELLEYQRRLNAEVQAESG